MRTFSLSFLFLFTSLATYASSPTDKPFAPNEYKCSGNGVELNYSIGYWDGAHNPYYRFEITKGLGCDIATSCEGSAHAPFTASRGDVKREQTMMGEIVSATVASVPDLMLKVASIVIPKVNLKDPVFSVDFDTLFVVTKTMSQVGGPAFVVGLVDQSDSVVVHCKASAVL